MEQTKNQPCQEWVPQLAACALGEQPDADLRTHLETCSRCRAELRSFGRVVRVLPYSAPAVAPPAQLRDRILEAAAGRPVAKASKPKVSQRLRRSWPTFVWAAVVGLLLGWNLALIGQLRNRESDFDRMQASLNATRAELAAARTELNEAQAELSATVDRLAATTAQVERSRTNWGTIAVLFNSPNLQVTPIGGEGTEARVWFTPNSSEACLVAQGLPDPGDGKVYQVWLNRGDTKVSGGTFSPVGENSWIVVRAEEPVASFGTLGITVEPAGGSEAPTTPPVLRGPLSGGAS